MAHRWHSAMVAAFAFLIAGCTAVPSPSLLDAPTLLPSPPSTALETAAPTAEPSPTEAASVACAFGDPQRDVCQKAAAAAQKALPSDHGPITAIQISNSATLSICHFGDPAWTPSPSNPEDGIGCRAIAEVTMSNATVSMVLIYDHASDDWRLDSIRQAR